MNVNIPNESKEAQESLEMMSIGTLNKTVGYKIQNAISLHCAFQFS